ncbi:hypothetical protein [Cupriavidus basilensis]|uniref:hypothetical protein n=1 Tax=Cupriavidus basilensis TaxID=68895 RepID=UPI00157AE546|nr:hypothetical protein [Cupriavidus basilensis]
MAVEIAAWFVDNCHRISAFACSQRMLDKGYPLYDDFLFLGVGRTLQIRPEPMAMIMNIEIISTSPQSPDSWWLCRFNIRSPIRSISMWQRAWDEN